MTASWLGSCCCWTMPWRVAAERPALADGADSGAQRFAMFAEVRRRLAQAARPSGLLLVLDDLRWADEASAVLLADVVRQLRGTPILVLATLPGVGGLR